MMFRFSYLKNNTFYDLLKIRREVLIFNNSEGAKFNFLSNIREWIGIFLIKLRVHSEYSVVV